jgi:predicted dinucleotide-binding enzyme
MDRKEAGFVGLGLMGAPMAANLLKAGWAVTAWNRSPGVLEAFEALGGARAAGVESLRDAPVIIFMLPDLSFIEEAAAGLLAGWSAQPLAAGTAVVVMSSVSPSAVQAFGARVSAASGGNAVVVDAPVSGGTTGAADVTLAVMVGADEADFVRLLPLFGAMGRTVRRLGPLGSGSLAKACNQLIVGTTTAALAVAVGTRRTLRHGRRCAGPIRHPLEGDPRLGGTGQCRLARRRPGRERCGQNGPRDRQRPHRCTGGGRPQTSGRATDRGRGHARQAAGNCPRRGR